MKKSKTRTPEQIRQDMKDFCLREVGNHKSPRIAYIAALSSAAHLCDQIARERGRNKLATEAAKQCGDLIWEVYEAVRAI